ncbi:MAG: cyclic pyranopterin monophosphate synthase MoaC [Euryarchaeota archaeon]|nr:cyclic pyranopterin monophosphate synthase MoaC [Euryarchaeota archaeon]
MSEKGEVERVAVASGRIQLKRSTVEKITGGTTKKGNVLGCAEIAAILAVKKTPEVIPMCHQINIETVKVEFAVGETEIKASVFAKSVGKTGVEMDALHGLSVALLTIWDMVKAEEKDETGNYPHTRIEEIQVDKKEKRPIGN